MAYATTDDYVKWLSGRGETIPRAEFGFWSMRASEYIDFMSFDRLHDDDVLAEYKESVIKTTCALAELIFANESPQASKELASYSIGGDYSESYVKRDESTHSERLQGAIRRGLASTGILSRAVY